MISVIQSTFVGSSANYTQCPKDQKPEVALIGRSNVGKSSLINALLGRKQLAKISKKPGKTQLINHFSISDQSYLVDLPGYGWAQVSKSKKIGWEKMIKNYLLYRPNLVSVFVLIDASIPPQNIDLSFIAWLGAQKIPFAIIGTKVDKKVKTGKKGSLSALKKIVASSWEPLPPFFITSSRNRVGLESIWSYFREITKIR